MDSKAQNDLRNKLCDLCLAALGDDPGNLPRVIAAVHGTLAVVIGALSEGERPEICASLDGMLLEHANRYAERLRSGEFDEQSAISVQ